jgi:hypothetical protein
MHDRQPHEPVSVGLWQRMVHPHHELTLQGHQAGPEYTHRPGDFAIQESCRSGGPRQTSHAWRVSWWHVCDGSTLLPQWWPHQNIASQDPEEWRIIMVAVAAVGTHLPGLCV